MTGSPVASFTIPETLNLSACRLEALTFIAGMKKQKHSNRLSTRNVLVSVRVFHVHNTFFKGLTNKDNSFYLPAKVRGTEKKQEELLPEKGLFIPIEPISGNNQPSYFII